MPHSIIFDAEEYDQSDRSIVEAMAMSKTVYEGRGKLVWILSRVDQCAQLYCNRTKEVAE